jgi:hypothetical protein
VFEAAQRYTREEQFLFLFTSSTWIIMPTDNKDLFTEDEKRIDSIENGEWL